MALLNPPRPGCTRAAALACLTRAEGSAGSGGLRRSSTGINWPGKGSGSAIVTISTGAGASGESVAAMAGASSSLIAGGLADVVAQPASVDAEISKAGTKDLRKYAHRMEIGRASCRERGLQ